MSQPLRVIGIAGAGPGLHAANLAAFDCPVHSVRKAIFKAERRDTKLSDSDGPNYALTFAVSGQGFRKTLEEHVLDEMGEARRVARVASMPHFTKSPDHALPARRSLDDGKPATLMLNLLSD